MTWWQRFLFWLGFERPAEPYSLERLIELQRARNKLLTDVATYSKIAPLDESEEFLGRWVRILRWGRPDLIVESWGFERWQEEPALIAAQRVIRRTLGDASIFLTELQK